MLVSKNDENLRHLTQNPNASQWNIGCVGFQTQNVQFGHVHLMLFVLISFAFVASTNPVSSGIWTSLVRHVHIQIRKKSLFKNGTLKNLNSDLSNLPLCSRFLISSKTIHNHTIENFPSIRMRYIMSRYPDLDIHVVMYLSRDHPGIPLL